MAFYITLPSNSSMAHYPDNQPHHFYTKLPQPIQLSADYEVGLAEIQFSNSYMKTSDYDFWISFEVQFPESEAHRTANPEDKAIFVHMNRPAEWKITIPKQHFESSEAFVTLISESVKESFRRVNFRPQEQRVGVTYLPTTRQVVLSITSEEVLIKISPDLQKVLGFSSSIFESVGDYVSDDKVDLNHLFDTVFVYCDLVQPRPVGDALVPLLRTVPTMDKDKPITFRTYDKPHYLPVSRLQFDTVEILLTTDSGDKVPFTAGRAVVTLHFRRKRPEQWS